MYKSILVTLDTTPTDRVIIEHVKLLRAFLENAAAESEGPLVPAINWKPVPEQGHTIVAIHTWDREQLLPKVAGSFSVVPLNILSVDTFTRGEGFSHSCSWDPRNKSIRSNLNC